MSNGDKTGCQKAILAARNDGDLPEDAVGIGGPSATLGVRDSGGGSTPRIPSILGLR